MKTVKIKLKLPNGIGISVLPYRFKDKTYTKQWRKRVVGNHKTWIRDTLIIPDPTCGDYK